MSEDVAPNLIARMASAVGTTQDKASLAVTQAVLGIEEREEVDEPLPLFPLSLEGSHARITALQESAAAWLATVVRCGGSSIGSLLNSAPSGLSERMFLGSSVPTEDGTSSQSLPALFNSGMASPGLFLTLNNSEWLSLIHI